MRLASPSSLALAMLLGLPGAALAQAEAPSPRGTSAHAQCRAQVDSRSLTGPERKAAMRDCMKPQRDACRSQAIAKGVAKGPDRKAFMHRCLGGTVAEAR